VTAAIFTISCWNADLRRGGSVAAIRRLVHVRRSFTDRQCAQQPVCRRRVSTFCIVSWIGIQGLGYVEFHAAGRMLFQSSFRRTLNVELALRGARVRLAQARDPQERWEILQAICEELGFCRIQIETPGMRLDKCVAAACAWKTACERPCAACRNAWTI